MRIVSVLIAMIIAQIVCAQTQTINKLSNSSSQFTVINTGTTDYLLSISKINNNLLISGYSNYLAKSYDNCNTLIPVNTPVFLETPENRYYRITRVDTNYLYMSYKTTSSNWKFFKSVDGGNSWIKKKDSTGMNLFYVEPLLLFYDTINASIMFSYNTALYTKNSLTTYTVGSWQPTWISNAVLGYGTIVSDSMAIFGEELNGGAYMTKNRGNTWQGTLIGGQVRDIDVVNKDTVYYISSPTPATSLGFFGYTFDGGLTWPYKSITSPTYFFNITVKNKNEIYVTAREPSNFNGPCIILKTTDLGQTWSKFTTPFVANLYDMKFLNDSVALICGDSGLLVKWNTKQAVFVGMKENSKDNIGVSVYPNPVKDKLQIEFKEVSLLYRLTLTDQLGRNVYSGFSKNKKEEIDLYLFDSGLYYLKVDTEKGQHVFKVVKE